MKHKRSNIILILIIFVSYFLFVFISLYRSHNDMAHFNYTTFSLNQILYILLSLFLFFRLLHGTFQNTQMKSQLSMLEKQDKAARLDSAHVKKQKAATIQYQQAIQEQLSRLHTLLQDGKYEQAQIYEDEIASNFQSVRYRPVCADNLINAVVDIKQQAAAESQIKTNIAILLPPELTIHQSSDISTILLNLLDNAMESCLTVSNHSRLIELRTALRGNYMVIHMTNSKSKDVNFNHSTTKSDRLNHGYGLSIIEDLAASYQGYCQWDDCQEHFESTVMLYLPATPEKNTNGRGNHDR